MRRALRAAVDEQGTEIVEFALIILPLLSFVFLIFSISWIFFAQASLQYAVREGCRYAVTNPGSNATPIPVVVQQNSFGFIKPEDLGKNIVTVVPSSNAGINIVTVSVNHLAIPIIGGSFFNTNSIGLSASSSDALESPPPPGS